MKLDLWHHNNLAGVAIVPRTHTDTTPIAINGTGIAAALGFEPWRIADQLTFLAIGGTVDASLTTAPHVYVQGLKRSDGTTWETVKQKDGTTDLEFTAALLLDAAVGGLENSRILGVIDLSDWKSETYMDIRLRMTVTPGSAKLWEFGAAWILSALKDRVINQTDDMYTKLHGTF